MTTPLEKRMPCAKDCPERAAGCHGKCERYAAFRQEREAVYKAREARQEVRDYIGVGIERARKRKRTGRW